MAQESFSPHLQPSVNSPTVVLDNNNVAEEALLLGSSAGLADGSPYPIGFLRKEAGGKRYILPGFFLALLGILGIGASLAAFGRSQQLSKEHSERPLPLDQGEGEDIYNNIGERDTRTVLEAPEQQRRTGILSLATGIDIHAPHPEIAEPPPEISEAAYGGLTFTPQQFPKDISAVQNQVLAKPSTRVRPDWEELPGVDEAEKALPPQLMLGKSFLTQAVEQVDESVFDQSPDALESLAILARKISSGITDEIIGLEIRLNNVKPLGSTDNFRSITVKVAKFLGSGSSNTVVAVVDTLSNEHFAMRILYKPLLEHESVNSEVLFGLGSNDDELEIMEKACGNTPVAFAASERGIALAQFTARIDGVPDFMVSNNILIFGQVQLMERLYSNLAFMIALKMPAPIEAKVYFAQRLLLEVLHLQEAGVVHNDIKLENCFMREDGSFLLGDFGSSTLFEQPERHVLTHGTPAYLEPSLFFSSDESDKTDVLPNPKSDMWSLGTVLYEVFLNGQLPYSYQNQQLTAAAMTSRAEQLLALDVSSIILIPRMTKARVPPRWQSLICSLLEPIRERRIGAREVAQRFGDLYGARKSGAS